jgi:hypothetical protein
LVSGDKQCNTTFFFEETTQDVWAYHCGREMIAAKVLGYYWLNGKNYPAAIVSKHWGYQQVWLLLKPLLFYRGNTFNVIKEDGEMLENLKVSSASQESL